MGPLLLLDSASLYFRTFFGVKGDVRAPDGTPVGAVRGFLDAIATLVRTRGPSGLVACWDDDWRPAFRVAALPSYKEHRLAPGSPDREETPPELDAQVPIISAVLAALGIARVGAPGCEADDVIGTLTTRAVAVGRAVEIVTGDRDLFQLVDDAAGVTVLYTGRGLSRLETVDQQALVQRYGVETGQAYADLATLRGDPSDGLPGVPGIGEKTAAALLARYGSLAGILAAAQHDGDARLSATQRSRIMAAWDYLTAAPTVVQVLRDAALPQHDDAVPQQPADAVQLAQLAEHWGLTSPIARLQQALAAAGAPESDG